MFLGLFTTDARADAEPKTVIALFDLSDSTPAHRTDYRKYFEKVVGASEAGDVLIAARIAAEPFAASNLIKRTDIPVFSVLERGGKAAHEAKVRAARRGILEAADKALADLSAETPILDTLMLVERQFVSAPNSRKVLVLFSDMKEFTKAGKINFESPRAPLDRAVIEKLIVELVAKGRIANLRGVKVFVAGARERDPKRYGQVRDFWFAYFAKAGAALDPNDYGPDRLRFAP